MLKRLTRWVTTDTALFLSILCLGFGISLLGANCNSDGNKTPTEDTTKSSAVSNSTTTPGHGVRVNWLQDIPRNRWDTIHFKSDPSNNAQIENEKRGILSYLWDSLTAYNVRIKAINPDTSQYIVDSFYFERKSGASLRFTVKAFLTPEVRPNPGHAGHLIPSEPDPPGGSQ